jgi:hypothetical protein
MGKENQGEEQGQRIPSESARTRNTTTTYSTTYLNIKKYSTNSSNKSDHSATT